MKYFVSLSGENPSPSPLQQFAGVGLVRGEFILRDRQESIAKDSAAFALQRYLEDVCQTFAGRPVWYRMVDLWSDEARTLEGAGEIPFETNPILGVRGLRRMPEAPELLQAELSAIAKVAQEHGNLHVMAPFVSDADDFNTFIGYLEQYNWPNRFGTMLETPSSILETEMLLDLGASNFLIGMNDLTCLMLGKERGDQELKTHRSLWKAIDFVRNTVSDRAEWGVAGSLTKDILEKAKVNDVPYVSVHYSELDEVLGVDPETLPDRNHVNQVRARTRRRTSEPN